MRLERRRQLRPRCRRARRRHLLEGGEATIPALHAIIETEKVDADLEAPESGVLKEILVQAGQTVDVGTVLARIE